MIATAEQYTTRRYHWLTNELRYGKSDFCLPICVCVCFLYLFIFYVLSGPIKRTPFVYMLVNLNK